MIRAVMFALALIAGPAAAQDDLGPWVAVARGVVDVDGGLMRLAAQREGLIAEVFTAEGARVEAGQVLARLDDSAARLQLRMAEVELEQARAADNIAALRLAHAEAELARLAPMLRADAIPARQGDEARRAVELAASEKGNAEIGLSLAALRLENAQLEVAAREIRAPVAGIILRSQARPGDGTSTSNVTEMFLLAPDGARVLRGTLDEQFIGKVSPGQRAEIVSERDGALSLTGEVARIAPVFGRPGQAQTDARSVEIVISLNETEAGALILGERLIARIMP